MVRTRELFWHHSRRAWKLCQLLCESCLFQAIQKQALVHRFLSTYRSLNEQYVVWRHFYNLIENFSLRLVELTLVNLAKVFHFGSHHLDVLALSQDLIFRDGFWARLWVDQNLTHPVKLAHSNRLVLPESRRHRLVHVHVKLRIAHSLFAQL